MQEIPKKREVEDSHVFKLSCQAVLVAFLPAARDGVYCARWTPS